MDESARNENAYNYLMLLEHLMANKGIEITARTDPDGRQEFAWFLPDGTPYVSPFLDMMPRGLIAAIYSDEYAEEIEDAIRQAHTPTIEEQILELLESQAEEDDDEIEGENID
jgi:hypothetical protein